MIRRQLPGICCAILFGAVILGVSNERGSAEGDIEDRKLEAFIEAAAAADGVMAVWLPRIAQAGDDDVEPLHRQANLEIRRSIEEVDGMSFDDYRRIRQAIALDADMLTRVQDMMRRRPRRAGGPSTAGQRHQASAARSASRRNRPLFAES